MIPSLTKLGLILGFLLAVQARRRSTPDSFLAYGPLCMMMDPANNQDSEEYTECHAKARLSFDACTPSNEACRCYYIGVAASECVKLCDTYDQDTFEALRHLCLNNPYVLNINSGADIGDLSVDPTHLESDLLGDSLHRDAAQQGLAEAAAQDTTFSDENMLYDISDLQWERNSLNPASNSHDALKDKENYRVLAEYGAFDEADIGTDLAAVVSVQTWGGIVPKGSAEASQLPANAALNAEKPATNGETLGSPPVMPHNTQEKLSSDTEVKEEKSSDKSAAQPQTLLCLSESSGHRLSVTMIAIAVAIGSAVWTTGGV
ncbi:hypothetical protein BABINDRAFT_168268 [Babjeviella inositovora NRRL Y-12698]|uniref:Extracellular membrane protein CFEM domain-containing protein n=1 Tax=Babjeviella inositovora NRRL Y-12698 TaxID=984486 RepID=A0A1E3QLP7_9ASCO|nr:uncharacterized protein BABINDRAFT_168268 [Babjeviella inositovora NRRL Y-12698]ODQ78538.1 hypothetical protein BABINDRAFT_168268 [Babjeviella inositovora NRRL Y-12698]